MPRSQFLNWHKFSSTKYRKKAYAFPIDGSVRQPVALCGGRLQRSNQRRRRTAVIGRRVAASAERIRRETERFWRPPRLRRRQDERQSWLVEMTLKEPIGMGTGKGSDGRVLYLLLVRLIRFGSVRS